VKDSIFQPSSPIRHTTEITDIMLKCHSEVLPMLSVHSDGGPDHGLTCVSSDISDSILPTSWFGLLWEVIFFPYTGHWSASTQRNGPGTSWRMVKHRYKHVAKGITARWFHRSSIKFSSLHKSKAKMLVEDKRMFQQKLKQQMLQQKEKEIEHLQSKQLEYKSLSEV